MKVKYIRTGSAVVVPGIGRFESGQVVDLPAKTAKALVETNPNFEMVQEGIDVEHKAEKAKKGGNK